MEHVLKDAHLHVMVHLRSGSIARTAECGKKDNALVQSHETDEVGHQDRGAVRKMESQKEMSMLMVQHTSSDFSTTFLPASNMNTSRTVLPYCNSHSVYFAAVG